VRDDVNQAVADKLRQAADLLAQQGANPFRVSAYRRAADAVVHEGRDLREILDGEGVEGLLALPHVGRGIAAAIVEMLRTGRWSQLDRLRGTLDPVRVFQTVPGIGPALAQRAHDTLGIDTLEALEIAAHDGRLEAVPGIGARRAATVRGALQSLLGSTRTLHRTGDGPGVATLLDVDREYREKAAAGTLRTIAPRRFNPEGKAWLPVLHARRGRWHLTALYSNTARAHELDRTHDWVVVYFYDDDHREGQHTIVTETQGPLAGQRVVRGREGECRGLHAGSPRRPRIRAGRRRPRGDLAVPAARA
jgi:putative hydrolase